MKRKRWIAAFLSLVMIFTMISPVSAKDFSKNSKNFGNKYSWSQNQETSRHDNNEMSQETSSADETTVEEAAVSEEITSDTETTVEEDTSAEAPAEEEAVPPEETEEQEAVPAEETGEQEAVPSEEIAEEETPVYMEGSLTGSDGIYNVTVTLGADAQIPEGSSLSVKELTEEDTAYQEAKEQVQAAEEEGFAALDISILDKEGNEIEPKAAVEVEIQLSQLPENVDADTEITVNHIDESTGTAVVQAVADTAEETEGTVEVSEDAAVVNFTVDSFSTFTITYGVAEEAAANDGVEAYAYGRLTAYLVDTNGNQIGSTTISTSGYSDWRSISNAVPSAPDGYEYVEARANDVNGEVISRIQYDDWRGWQYRTSNSRWGSELDAIYFVYQSTGPVQVTLSFSTNGGSGSVASITGTSGTSVTLPDYEGTRSGYTFLGWADSSAEFPGGTEYRAIYEPGDSYVLPDSNKTLYAAWQSDNAASTDGYFYIRLDGQIPYEPGTYESADYTIGIKMSDVIELQQWVVDVDTTKEIAGNCVDNNVTAVLTRVPSDELIQRVCSEAGISYNPDTQYILWYVQKYNGLGARALDEETGIISGTNGNGWHIDGVLLDREKVAISYDANVPTGVTEIPDVPQGYEVDRGTVVTVGQTGGVGGSMDRSEPSIPGYVFQGWNTSSDGTGTTYANGDMIPLYENMTLYAMWSKGENILSLAKVDGLGNTINGASFTISDGSYTVEFEAGTYRNEDIQTDTVYTITETAAPDNYEGLDESFNFIVSSQGGTGLTAYFCDAEGNRVEDDPDGVSLTYTNGLINIRVTNIGYFYVYHSSVANASEDNKGIEKIAITAENLNEDGTFNIVNRTRAGYYYGGYYSKYNKVGTAYAGGAGSWSKTNAYTVNGKAMTPVAGETYYLKEVPEKYLQPYMHVVYDERSQEIVNELKQMYLMTGVDDMNYQEIGLNTVNITLGTRKTTASFKVVDTVGDTSTTTLTTSSIWGVKGFLGVWDQSSDLKENYEFSYQPYFVTPDGVTVNGTTTRTVNTQNNHYYNTFDQTADNLGIYRIDSKE